MGSHAGHTAFIEHENLVRVHDGADALCHDDDSRIFRVRFKRMPQSGVGFVVQGGKAVVKQVDQGVFGNGAGNGKTLLLSA